MKDTIGSIFVFIFYGLIIYGEIGGIYHSVSKHKTADVLVSIFLPPWAWYRSVEMFWHDDFADVDWDKRLTNDVKTCVYFLNAVSQTDANVYKINEDIEEYSKKISHYPDDKRAFLKRASALYIGYVLSLFDDLVKSLTEYLDTQEFTFEFGARTLQLEDSLKQFKLEEELDLSRKAIDLFMRQTEEDSRTKKGQDLSEVRSKLRTAIELMKTKQRNTLSQAYKNLFDEDLNW